MLRILELDPAPVAVFQMLSVRPGRGGAESEPLPVLLGRCSGLPPALDALLLTGDLEGRSPVARRDGSHEPVGAWLARELLGLRPGGRRLDPDRTGVALTGDLFSDPALEQRGCCGNVDAVWRAFAAEYRWVLGVAGNHDRFESRAEIPAPGTLGGGRLLHGETHEVDGLRVAGLGGILGSNGKPWRLSPGEYLERLDMLIAARPDLLLLHEAPDGGHRCCKGNAAIRERLDSAPDELCVCFGHVNWLRPMLDSGPLQLVNVDSRVLILTR